MKRYSVTMIVVVLLLAAMACSVFGATDGTVSTGPDVETEVSQDTSALGDRVRSEEGGFSFKSISGYQVDTFFNFISIEPPQADAELGPLILLVGDFGEERTALNEVFDEFVEEYGNQSDFLVSDRRQVTVAGAQGYAADFLGETQSGETIGGRITLVVVSENQQFTMFGFAQIDRWKNEFNALYDDVLSSVEFFEPQ